MADFEAMYYARFNKITDVTRELQEIQELTEEMYISANPEDITEQEAVEK